jgi:hypothetical protein
MLDSLERWGDYTGHQFRYNQPGTTWISGSYGKANNSSGTVIAEIRNSDPGVGMSESASAARLVVFPNPAYEALHIDFEANEKMLVDAGLVDMQGKTYDLLKDFVKPGLNRLSLNVADLKSGIYFVNIRHNGKTILYKKLVVQH